MTSPSYRKYTTSPLFGQRIRAEHESKQVVGNSSYTATGVQHATLWTVPVPVVTPEQAIAGAVEDVAALVTDGALEAVQFQLDKGNTKVSTNMLGACINQVEAMANSGRLTDEKAQPLIDAVNTAIELIEVEP